MNIEKGIQEDPNAIVDYDEKFNNAIVWHTLDLKHSAIFQNPNPLNVTFPHVKKFDMTNPIIGNLAAQIKANKLSNEVLTKKILMQGEAEKIESRLAEIKCGELEKRGFMMMKILGLGLVEADKVTAVVMDCLDHVILKN